MYKCRRPLRNGGNSVAKYGGGAGYHRYRGRMPKWKLVLAVVLVLVILFSASLMLMQRHLFFDENGHAHLELPWGAQEPEHDTVDVPELDIQEPEHQALGVYVLPGAPLTMAEWETAREYAAANALDTAAVTLRHNGSVYFDSETAAYPAMVPAADTKEALAALTAAYDHAVGLFDCFPDPKASQKNLDAMGLKNTGGYIFYDGQNRNYLDPAKPEAVEYLSRLLTESAALGFDELVLQGYTFPTEGKLTKIAYTEGITRTEALNEALKAFRTALDQAGCQEVELSVELTAEQILSGHDEVAGVSLEGLSKTADAIYAETTLDQVPALEAAVQAAGTARFVPILSELPPQEARPDAFLVLPQ